MPRDASVTIATRCPPFMQHTYARPAALGSRGGGQTLFRISEESGGPLSASPSAGRRGGLPHPRLDDGGSLLGALEPMEPRVHSALRHELVVRPALDDAPLVEDDDAIRRL